MFRRMGRIRQWFLDQEPKLFPYLPFMTGDDKPAYYVEDAHLRNTESILLIVNAVLIAMLGSLRSKILWKGRIVIRKAIFVLIIAICVYALFLARNVSAANAPQPNVTAIVTATPMVTSMPTIQATPTIDPTVTALEKEKLQHENDWLWANSPALLSMLGVIVAVPFPESTQHPRRMFFHPLYFTSRSQSAP
jgi:hypothetical protein